MIRKLFIFLVCTFYPDDADFLNTWEERVKIIAEAAMSRSVTAALFLAANNIYLLSIFSFTFSIKDYS